jgi:hypothetical protein
MPAGLSSRDYIPRLVKEKVTAKYSSAAVYESKVKNRFVNLESSTQEKTCVKKQVQKRSKTLSAKQRKDMGIYTIPKESQRFVLCKNCFSSEIRSEIQTETRIPIPRTGTHCFCPFTTSGYST